MKRVIILLAVIFAFAANSFAQTGSQTDNQAAPTGAKMEKHKGGKPKDGKHGGARNLKKELNLTAEQETRMKDIGSTYKGKMKAIQTDNTLDKEQKKAQFLAVRNAHEAEVKGVMNADQYAKFTELKKQRHDKMKAHKGEWKGKGAKGKEQKGNEPAPKSN